MIGGLLVIGTLAAVASAASNANRGYRDRDYRYRDRDYRYRGDRGDYRPSYDDRFGESRGLERAAAICAREIDRDRRVGSIDGVVRSGEGWRVTGVLRSGEGFSCLIGNDGRIADIDFGPPGVAADRQWDADRYAAARAAHDGAPVPPYPGGPIGDEELNETR